MPYELSFVGLLASLAYISITGIHPGGVIVPSYLVVFLSRPSRLAATLAIALLTLLCYRLASRHLILFGSRRFAFMVLVAAVWTFLGYRIFPALVPASIEFQAIGWVIPGLISNTCERQGIWLTLASLATVTVAAFFLGRALGTII
ncbi:MAG: poly-gamma-glutamate biosynthesis protein PgsC [Acidobacteria bacterium]|nr:poly-gamma-glutamate biosynthesis protein PgsC [Acidobacteriota bacterium]